MLWSRATISPALRWARRDLPGVDGLEHQRDLAQLAGRLAGNAAWSMGDHGSENYGIFRGFIAMVVASGAASRAVRSTRFPFAQFDHGQKNGPSSYRTTCNEQLASSA